MCAVDRGRAEARIAKAGKVGAQNVRVGLVEIEGLRKRPHYRGAGPRRNDRRRQPPAEHVGVAKGKQGTPAGADADVEAPTLVERAGIIGEQARRLGKDARSPRVGATSCSTTITSASG